MQAVVPDRRHDFLLNPMCRNGMNYRSLIIERSLFHVKVASDQLDNVEG